MTVSTTTTRSTFTGDGVTTTFPFTFALQQASDMTVYVNTVLQTLGSQYTVSPAGGSYPCVGGNVVFQLGNTPVNLAAGLCVRVLTFTQTVQLPTEGSLASATLENIADRSTMQIQQVEEQLGRSITIPITTSGINTQLPIPVALDIIGWDSTAMNIVNYTPAQILANVGGVGTGNVIGPGTSTINSIALFGNATGTLLASTVALGTSGFFLKSQGAGQPPVFAAIPASVNNTYMNLAAATTALNPPTSGALTGEYWITGNWTTTGTLTFTNVRLHVIGNITINHAITVNTGLGSGSGFGSIGIARPGNSIAGQENGGAGGSYGGIGGYNGNGATVTQPPGYSIDHYLGGSGGVIGAAVGDIGGSGGGGVYLEATGTISINANITANGGVGNTGSSIGGGGGSGGAIDARSLSTITIAGGVTLAANGGAGGNNASAGGGGGGGGWVRLRGTTVTNSGTVTVTGGAAGTGGSALAGATGQTDIQSVPLGPRTN